MAVEDINAKDKIIKATIDILNEVGEPDKITVRQIAERAEVGVGLINYHFQSKENLLYKVISDTMGQMATELQKPRENEDIDSVERLKTMLKELTDFGIKYSKLSRVQAAYDLLQGDMQTPLYLVPVLREIYGSTKDEIEIRLIAFEIITTFQAAFVNSKAFQLYTGVDINNKVQRDKIIDTIIKSIINK